MAGRSLPVRLALAQINAARRRHRGQRREDPRVDRRRARGGRRARAVPGAGGHRLPAGGPAAQGALPAPRARGAATSLAAEARASSALVGFPERADDVYNALAVLADGESQAVYRKTLLPNYGVFDEQRYFQAGDGGAVFDARRRALGLTICEDIWTPGPPASDEALAGATLIVNVSARPTTRGKGVERERMLVQRARDNLCAVAFCNLVGGQDELVFDGHSLVVDHEGERARARAAVRRGAAWSATVDLQAAVTARLRDTRLRPPVRRALPEVRQLRPRRAARAAAGRARSAARSRRCSSPRPRSTPRSCSARATTSRRTASSASCSGSPAGSTRRSSR